ncbi:gluconokinase [Commensalibacter oyaizuii]|uniref:Gluconokinase n=1 Tax=Commensalibacter oyaizuii TaxID=3043873 RepID=A0ABT6Q2T2_9PROT|nr:gluconokinase [Commensalibacter sp. TBRC 16381]MDI2091404.1 gluconokinase [Commensalibacter sp. TBRC 16381]
MVFPVKNNATIQPCLLVVMGVSGCGKTTMATALKQKLGWPFQEGDALHPSENIKKMSKGIPLTDEDRYPWLAKCHAWLQNCEQHHNGCGILTCSALKKQYRKILIDDIQSALYFIYLKTSKEILRQRLQDRTGHFMPSSLLTSQLDTLEPPGRDEPCITVEMNHSFDDAMHTVWHALQQMPLKAGG